MTTISGNPDLTVALGSGGEFAITESASTVFHVSDTGVATVFDKLESNSGTLRLMGKTSTYVSLDYSGNTMDFKYTPSPTRHEIEVDASCLRLNSWGVVELQGGHAANDMVTVHGGSSGDKVLTFTYDSGANRVELVSATVGSPLKLRLTSPSKLELLGSTVLIESSATSQGEIATYRIDGQDRLEVNTTSDAVGLATLRESSGELVDDLDLLGEKTTLSTDRTTGPVAQFRSSTTTNRLEVAWESDGAGDRSVIKAVSPSEQLRPDLLLRGPTNIRALLDDEGYGGDTYFQVQRNVSSTLRTAFEVGWRDTNSRFETRFYDELGNTFLEMGGTRYNTDGELNLGCGLRGVLRLYGDSSAGRVGVLDLRDESNAIHYLWANSDCQLRMAAVAGQSGDPDTDPDSGYLVAGAPRPVIDKATAGPHSVDASGSGGVFTNEGASADVEYELPAWVEGLHFTFVKLETGYKLTITADGTDEILYYGTVSGPGGSVESADSGDSEGETVTLFAVKSGTWLVVSMVGSSWTVS